MAPPEPGMVLSSDPPAQPDRKDAETAGFPALGGMGENKTWEN